MEHAHGIGLGRNLLLHRSGLQIIAPVTQVIEARNFADERRFADHKHVHRRHVPLGAWRHSERLPHAPRIEDDDVLVR